MNTKFDLNDKVILKGRIDQITIDNDTNPKVVYIVSIHTGDSSYPNHIRIGENMLLKMQDCQKENWIPVDDYLPEAHRNVLVTNENGEVHMAMVGLFDGNYHWLTADKIIAWMYLPKPYEENEYE